MNKKILSILTTVVMLGLVSSAFAESITGQLMVSDTINNIGTVEPSKIPNLISVEPLIWKISPSTTTTGNNSRMFLNTLPIGVTFYAKLEGNILSILIVGTPELSLRGMLGWYEDDEPYQVVSPISGNTKNVTGTWVATYDGVHLSRIYDKSRTLLYRLMKDTLSDLKNRGAISPNAVLSGNYTYQCSFTDKIYVMHYRVTAGEYNATWWNGFHNWPWVMERMKLNMTPVGMFVNTLMAKF